ncbi:MAG: Nucleoside-diphosphate-sugar epimerase [Candidatus Thorarchaeota archaeon]|nr:MAG: Nucleoside-diphosphate-sugar epimerase [Candidatus Thorarchaeota archaeon]
MDYSKILDKYENSVVLITGGAGCIGSNLVRILLSGSPRKVIVLDDFSSSYLWNLPKDNRLDVVEGSILEEQKLKQVFYERPDFVFHLAAHFANQNSIDHPETDLMVNGLGHLRIMEYARLTEPQRVFFAGSGCSVYGSHAPIPFKETMVSLTLDTPYQIHKLLGELYCNHYHETYDLKTTNGRFFNVFGPGEVPGPYRNVIPIFTWRAMHEKPLLITGTGDETRDFAYVGDVVNGILRMGVFEKAVGEAINLASGKETSIKELATLINEITGNPAGIEYRPKRSWDKSNRRLASIAKAKELIGYEPQMEFKQGLKNVHGWLKSYKSNIVESIGPSAGLW